MKNDNNINFWYEDYLKEREKNPKIRKISRKSWNVYKSTHWVEGAIKFLQIKNYNPWRTGIYKISNQDICDIKADIKAGISKEKIAYKYWVTTRSIYRYNKLKCNVENK